MFKQSNVCLLVYASMSLMWSACVENCPPHLPYFDISKIELYVESRMLENEQKLRFEVAYSSVKYLSESSFCFGNSLYAASTCKEDGILGLKYPIVEIEIFADRDFGSYLQGTSLQAFLSVEEFAEDISSYDNFKETHSQGFNPENMTFELRKPDFVSGDFNFTLVFINSDNKPIIKKIENVSWQ